MLASTWLMKAPMHTVPTTNQRYDGSRATARSGGGSRPLSTASRNAASEAGPGDESGDVGFWISGSATFPPLLQSYRLCKTSVSDRSAKRGSGETFSPHSRLSLKKVSPLAACGPRSRRREKSS